MANAVFTKGEGNKGTIKFEVPVDVYEKGIDAAFNDVKKQITVPGFRKGKMPKQVFIQMYGEESLYQDALNIVCQMFTLMQLQKQVLRLLVNQRSTQSQ